MAEGLRDPQEKREWRRGEKKERQGVFTYINMYHRIYVEIKEHSTNTHSWNKLHYLSRKIKCTQSDVLCRVTLSCNNSRPSLLIICFFGWLTKIKPVAMHVHSLAPSMISITSKMVKPWRFPSHTVLRRSLKRCWTNTQTNTHFANKIWLVGSGSTQNVSSAEGYAFVPTDPFKAAEKELRRKLSKHFDKQKQNKQKIQKERKWKYLVYLVIFSKDNFLEEQTHQNKAIANDTHTRCTHINTSVYLFS